MATFKFLILEIEISILEISILEISILEISILEISILEISILEIYVAGSHFCEILKCNLPKIIPHPPKKSHKKLRAGYSLCLKKMRRGTSQKISHFYES